MSPFLVDTHCHLHFPPYDQDREAVLLRMREKKIWGITIGTSVANSERGVAFAEQHPDIWATVGLHPEHLSSSFHDTNEGDVVEQSLDPAKLASVARSSKKVVAIGETGLDFFRIDAERDRAEAQAKQEQSFLQHLVVAHELQLPVVIHCREALGRLARIIQEEHNAGRKPRGVVHSFTGTWEEAKPLLDLGLHIAVNGIATFPPKKGSDSEHAIDRTIERIPVDRLLLETDAPYLAPAPFRGKRNEPAYVEDVAKHVANVRQMSLEDVARMTTENAVHLFHLTQ